MEPIEIQLFDQDNQAYKMTLLEIFSLDEQSYALLQEEGAEDFLLMKVQEDRLIVITEDEEFQRVSSAIQIVLEGNVESYSERNA